MLTVGNFCDKSKRNCECLQYIDNLRNIPTCTAVYCPLRDKKEDRDKLIEEYNKKQNN